MPQIQCPIDYVPLQQVTAANLNAHVNSAVILPGIITDQTNLAANTVASGDSVLLYDLSATALREANVSDVLGSNVPVTTSAITAGANSDILVTPNDGTIVTGQSYTSADGLTVTVTSTAHILTVGQVILVTAAGTGYNGTFRVATIATNSFTYVMTTAATAGSGTLSYTKKGLVKNLANKSIAGNLYVDGTTEVNGSAKFSQSVLASGSVTASGSFTSSGTANFTGALQVNGTVGYVLTEIVEETLASWSAASAGVQSAVVTTASFTKPADEIWVLEIEGTWTMVRGYGASYAFRYSTETFRTGAYLKIDGDYSSGVTALSSRSIQHSWVVPLGTALTARTVAVDVLVGSGSQLNMFGNTSLYTDIITTGTLPVSKFRIYKYKTA
jgi:hypothetical protein